MNMKNLLKKAFLLLALVGGAMNSWAIGIPQNLGSYIAIGTVPTSGSNVTASGVTLTGCKVDGNAKDEEYTSYTVGSTDGSTVRIEFALTAEAGNYLFSFKSGAQDASTVSLSLTNSSSQVVWSQANESIEDTDSWSLTKSHNFVIGNLTAGTYTMTITGESKTGSYYGNFGNFCFHKSTQYVNNWNNTVYVDFSDATSNGNSLSGTYINNLTVGSYVDFYTYTPNAGNNYYISAQFGYGLTDGSNNFTVTITDVSSSTIELNAQSYTINKGDDTYWVNSNLTAGWKKVRISFPNTIYNSDNEHTMRCQGFRFGEYDDLPLTGTATLNLNQAGVTFNNCKYEDGSSNIGYVKNGGYADGYYVYSSEPTYYNLSANVPWFNNAGTFTMTVTDVATSTVEATVTSSSITATGAVMLKIDNQITAGLKRIRFDFAGEGGDYLFNLNNVSFSPVTSVSGTITPAGWCSFASSYPLDLSTISGGSTAYYASEAEGSTVTLSTTTATVPAGEGLMIKGTPNAPFTINVAASGTSISGNKLIGQTTTGNVTASGTDGKYHYVFGYQSSSVYGFYNLTEDTSVSEGKAYLETTSALTTDGSGARAISIVLADDILTGIEKVENGEVKSSLPVKRIVNGKLVIEKKGMMFNANGARIY